MAAVLLFLVLREMTGSLWRSAFVAAVFAIHPLRVESVAWIAERKDVLSGVFFMLTLWAYARYARQPSRWHYVAVALWYGLGLLCKNTLVTLPFVLLLLDWWPLHRVTLDEAGGPAGRMAIIGKLAKEKIPLFLLSVGSCVATALVPEKLPGSERLLFLERIENAVVSYGIYLRQMIYPAGLAIPYPNPPNGLPFWEVALALVLLAAISIGVLACWKKRPFLLVGWLWYLGMLVPMIGIVQISYYAHADRYTYLPQIGIYVAVTWLAAECRLSRAAFGSLMTGVLAVLMFCAWKQTAYWKDNEILWTHTLDCTTVNEIAHYNFGNALFHKGRVDAAIPQYREALQISPDSADVHDNLGNALLQKGSVDEAITHYQSALQIKSNLPGAQNNLGNALLQEGKVDEAIAHYQKALEINPHYEQAHNGLGSALLEKGSVDEAIIQYREALQIKPDHANAQANLGIALFRKGSVDEAIVHFQKALEIKPDNASAQVNFGAALLQKDRVDEAIGHYQKALEINADYADACSGLGNAFLQKGSMAEAIAQYQKALQLKPVNPEVQNNLAWLLATCSKAFLRNGNKAVELARQANALTGGDKPVILATLAAAFAEAGRFSEAVETAQHALRLAEAQSNASLAGQLQLEMKLYQAGSPYHLPAQTH
jgi:tetratricopeptide (TPR) repeat protein